MIETKEIYKIFSESSGVFTDTRKPLVNGFYIALKGPLFNGNKYALKALQEGAIAAIVDDYELSLKNEKLIYVLNTYSTLKSLAKYHRKKLKCPVFAITGSNGKTTTKELIKKVFEEFFDTHATIGNLNNHIGVPLTILNTPLDSEFTIIEMGANHLYEIQELCEIAEPTHGFVTNFGKAHIEGFGSESAIIEGKSELYNYLLISKGTIFVDIDNKNQLKRLNKTPFVSFGQNKKSDYPISYSNINNELEVTFKGENFKSPLHGEYNLKNIAAAIVIGYFFRIPITKIRKGIETYKSNNNRSQFIKLKNHEIILDAYNANPSSMYVAIQSFKETYPEHAILILGDMLELGDQSSIEHEKILLLVKKLSFSRIITVGENFEKIKIALSNIEKFSSTKKLLDYLKINPLKDKYVFIKGSRSMQLEKILTVL